MKCPYCFSPSNKVVDKRETENDKAVRRRRECKECNKRFTTYERIEGAILFVKKKNGTMEAYSREKLESGIIRSCEKRPVSLEQIRQIVNEVDKHVKSKGEPEISSSLIGRLIMTRLKKIDKVSYIRFASVYKDFKDPEEFQEELDKLERKNG